MVILCFSFFCSNQLDLKQTEVYNKHPASKFNSKFVLKRIKICQNLFFGTLHTLSSRTRVNLNVSCDTFTYNEHF